MIELLSKNWWKFVARGVCAIVFGVLAFAWPGITLLTLVILFGVFALIDGIFSIITAISMRETMEDWWVLLLRGLAGVGIGLITYLAPGVTAFVLILYIAVWSLVTGVLELVVAIRLRKVVQGEFWLILSGIASIAFAFLLLARPGVGALSILWIIAIYAVIFGILLTHCPWIQTSGPQG